jgi:hypothetical protein
VQQHLHLRSGWLLLCLHFVPTEENTPSSIPSLLLAKTQTPVSVSRQFDFFKPIKGSNQSPYVVSKL